MKQVILGSPGERSSRAQPDEQAAWAMVFLVGASLVAIGATDVAMLFYPARFASLDWEFGTISAFVDGLPVMTIGFSAMIVASAARGWRRWRGVLAALALLMAIATLVMLMIFVLDAPAAFRAINPAMRQSLTKAVVKTGFMGFVYVCLYAALGVWTWRRLKSSTSS